MIRAACRKSETFRFKYEYWVIKRKKGIDHEWLMNLLEKSLGREFVLDAARRKIENDRKNSMDNKES